MTSLTKSERAVLSYLARHGPAIGNQMSKSPGLSTKTASTAPRSLKRKGFVSCTERKTSRPGFEYSLTLPGLRYVSTTEELHPRGFAARRRAWRPIINRWAHLLPLVFGKWQVFIDAGYEEYVQALLETTLALSPLFVDRSGPVETESVEDLQQCFYGLVNEILFVLEEGKHLRWLQQVCARDAEIREFVIRHMDVALSELDVELSQLSKKQELVRVVKELI